MISEHLSNLPYSIVLHPANTETAISFSDLELTYQTPYRNIYADLIVKEVSNLSSEKHQNFLREFFLKGHRNIETLRCYRIICQINAIFWKYKKIRIVNYQIFP